jgi:hypothetical protein
MNYYDLYDNGSSWGTFYCGPGSGVYVGLWDHPDRLWSYFMRSLERRGVIRAKQVSLKVLDLMTVLLSCTAFYLYPFCAHADGFLFSRLGWVGFCGVP